MGDGLQRLFDGFLVAAAAYLPQATDLRFPNGTVVYFEDFKIRIFIFVNGVAIDPHYFVLTAVDAGLFAGGGLFYPHFRYTCFYSFRHSAKVLNLVNMLQRLFSKIMSEPLYIITSTPRINYITSSRFLLNE